MQKASPASSKTNVAPMNDTKRGKQDTSMTKRWYGLSVLLSEIEWVWICLAFKIDSTNPYFDLSEVLCPMLFLSESLVWPSGYFQAGCWLLAESSLHSWTKLQPTILERPQWLVKSRLMPLMHSLHGLQEKSSWSICDWGSRRKLGLQKAIEVATFSRDFNNSICYMLFIISVFVAESAIGSVLTLLQDVGVSGGQQELLSQLQHAERTLSYQITSTSHSFTTTPKSR